MKKIFIILLVLILTSGTGILFGQGATTAEKLALAARLSEEFNRKKAEAVKIALEKGWPVRVEYQDGRVMEIMEIGPNGFPEYNTTFNEDAAETTNTDDLWVGGSSGLNLTGSGFTIGEWDAGGVLTTHVEFRVGGGTSRVTQKDTPGSTHYHSTHVAGTMIAEGDAAGAQGMASQANLHAYDWDDDVAEMLNANAIDNIILSNHSYGRTRGWSFDDYGTAWWFGDTTISGWEDYEFGFYGPLTKTWDSVAYVMPEYLIVKSAGNDRNDDHTGGHYVFNPLTGYGTWSTTPRDEDGGPDGYDCLGNQGVTKNGLTVGAVLDIPGGYTQPSDVDITEFSSYGPTDDGRIKPDIVANGYELYSCSNINTTYYEWLSGTSMSSPNVTGTLALLQQYFYTLNSSTYMMADELKALTINCAQEAGSYDGPDYKFGWGLMDALAMANAIRIDDSVGGIQIRRSTLTNTTDDEDEYVFYSDGSEPIRVTLCWIDPPHNALAPSLNPTTICLVNDLDLRVITPQDTAKPWRLNPFSPSSAATRLDNYRDNVERIDIESPPPGRYTVRITHKGSVGVQYYALVVSGLYGQRFTNTWTGGAADDYWYRDANWSLGHNPVVDEPVVIPSGSSFHPIIDVSNATCYSLNLGSDTWLEIRDNTLTIDQDLSVYGKLEMDNSAGVLTIGDDAYWYSGSTADILAGTVIWVYGDWVFHTGTNVNMTNGVVDFTGTGISYIYTYDSDASFFNFGDYKTGDGYVEHSSSSSQPLRTNSYFYLHSNSEFRSNTTQPVIVKGYFSKSATATCNLINGTFVMDGTASSIYFDAPGYFNNLTISPSVSITLQDNIDVNGDLLIEEGTLVANNHRIYLAGDWTNTVGDAGFNETGSRVIFDQADGPSSNILSGENFDTLDVNIFDQVIMSGLAAPVTCEHFICNAGGINVTNSTFTIEDLMQSGIFGYWFVNSGGTVNMYQDASNYIDLFGSINMTTGGTFNVFGGLDDSFWGISSGSSLTMSGGTLDFVNRGVRIYNNYPFTESITGGTIRTASRFNVNRTDFNPTSGTIEFRSTNDGYISHYAGSNFYNILINKYTSPLEMVPVNSQDFKGHEKVESAVPSWQFEMHNKKEKVYPPSKSTIVYLASDLDINGNLTIDEGILNVTASNYSISIAGSWTDNVDLTGFSEMNGKVTFDGSSATDINTSETFYKLVLDKTYASYNGLEIDAGNIVYVNDSLILKDGTFEINAGAILDVSGHLTIQTGAGLNAGDDLNVTVRIEGNFVDNNASFTTTQGFYSGSSSTVLFYGSTDQIFQTAGTTGIFDNLTIDKSGGTFRTYESLELKGDLSVVAGAWQDNAANLTHLFRGNYTISPGASFYNTTGCTCKFIGSADQVISFDPPTTDGYFMNLTVDKSIAKDSEPGGKGDKANTVTLATDIIALGEGNLTVNYGTLDFNGNYFRAAGDVKIYSGGKITIDDDAWLEVGGSDSLIVFSGGTLEVMGSAGHPATVKGHNSNNYAFEVRSGGTISAARANFYHMGTEGLYILSGGLVNPSFDFDYCSLGYGLTGANALLRIDNNQTLTIDSAYFPTSTTTKNVSKTLNQGTVNFVGATGDFSGPLYENDPNARIFWAETGKWDGSASSDWNVAANWTFDVPPTDGIDVVIPTGCPNYPILTDNLGINTSSFAYDCKSITILAGGKLTLSGAYDIVSYGILNSAGDLIVGDDYDARSGSVLNIQGDTAKIGVNTPSGLVYLYSGSEINMTGGDLMSENYTLNDGCWVHGTNGTAHLSVLGTAPAEEYIRVFDEDSYFWNFMVDAGANASMQTSTFDLNTAYSLDILGAFTNNGKTVTAQYMDVNGTLNVSSGLITVTGNGPYFHSGGVLNLSGGTIDAGTSVYWYNGSTGNITGGIIYAATNWALLDGCNVTMGTGNTLYFNQAGTSYIYNQDASSTFGNLDISKPLTSSYNTYIHANSTYPMIVSGDLYLRASNQFHLQGEDLTVMGALVNETTSVMDMATGSDFINTLDYTLNGSLTMSGGNATIHGRFTESSTGVLTITDGVFTNDKALELPATDLSGTLNMSNGIFEISHMSTEIKSTFVDNIAGGTMRFGSTLLAADNCFQPAGGTVDLINFSGTGYPYLQIGTVNWLQNLTVNSNIQWYISGSGSTQLTIKKDLIINSGGLIGTDDVLYIGDDWTNNVGTSGFNCGTASTVYLNGAVATPERQVISGNTTFYNLSNLNTSAVVEFAGPITVNNNYYGGGGGAACETFITGTPISIQTLNLTTGNFALSTSAPVVSVISFSQGGTVQVTNGSFTVNDLVENYIGGAYTIYNGQINLTQDASSLVDLNANLYIHGGAFNVLGGTDLSYWPYMASGSLTMDAGVLDFQTVGIHLYSDSFTENVTGGMIRTAGYFTSGSGITFFTPGGGAVELYGDDYVQVNMAAGCWFHDMYAAKTAPATVEPSSSLTVKGELKVKSSEFNTNGYQVTVGE